jgi:hypothetical protein
MDPSVILTHWMEDFDVLRWLALAIAGFQTRAPTQCAKKDFLFYIFGAYIFVYFK